VKKSEKYKDKECLLNLKKRNREALNEKEP